MSLTNSDLEMAGLLMLWLVMEDVCDFNSGAHAALFSDNQPTVSWVDRLVSKGSKVAGQLIRALALRLSMSGVSPITTLHIRGIENAMTDIHHGLLAVKQSGIAKLMLTFSHFSINLSLYQTRPLGPSTPRAARLLQRCFLCCGQRSV